MPLYNKYSDIDDKKVRIMVLQAIAHITKYCEDIADHLQKDFTITIEGKTIVFFDIRKSSPHYYIELLRESGIVNIKGYGEPTIKIIGG